MENYKKKDKPKEKTEENEIRGTSKGQIKSYLGYAFRILEKTDHQSVIISATGNAILVIYT